jgi:hypothetical protein
MSRDALMRNADHKGDTGTEAPRRSGWTIDVSRRLAHMERCRALPTMRPGEAERLTAAFIAARGITRCPPAYVVAVQQVIGGA